MVDAPSLRPAPVVRPLAQVAGLLQIPEGVPEVGVSGICLDSRRVVPGDLYAALPGEFHHGASFMEQAVRNGAVAVVTDQSGADLIAARVAPDRSVPVWVVEDPRAVLGSLAAWVYGNPADDLSIVGITGTDGKTTTSMLLEAALQATGRTTGLIGTVVTRIADQEVRSVRTTPEAPDLHALLAVMRERGVTTVVMEVSSHALAFGRVDGVLFDVAIFTNLGHDHLDFHKSLEAYFATKASLFTAQRAKRGLVCLDDQWGRRLLAQATIPMESYSVIDDQVTGSGQDRSAGASDVAGRADWDADVLAGEGVGFRYRLRGPAGLDLDGITGLAGTFNVRNSVAAAATAIMLGGEPRVVLDAIAGGGSVPGRMEPVDVGQSFVVLVDYAHTPDAVGRALDVGHDLATRRGGRLLVVLGCGGDRDREKRPLMGAVAARTADVVLITDDNPRSEDAGVIRSEILAGAQAVLDEQAVLGERTETTVQVIERAGRESALRDAVQMAQDDDVVMALGKGHEQGQEIAGVVYPLDDREILRAQIRMVLR